MILADLKPSTSRTTFIETWLCEMPSGLGTFETFETLEYSIKDFLKYGIKVVNVNGVNKIDAGDKVFYWFEANGSIQLATELHKKSEGLVVSLTGKNPKLRGRAPYASELYSVVLKDSGKNIRLMSDTQLSDEGLALWKKLVKQGHKVSVYDAANPGKSFKSFETPAELDAFFKDGDTNFKRFQYVLSEELLSYCSMRASFRLRLLRETVGHDLTDAPNPVRVPSSLA
jgi:hypothetical protein